MIRSFRWGGVSYVLLSRRVNLRTKFSRGTLRGGFSRVTDTEYTVPKFVSAEASYRGFHTNKDRLKSCSNATQWQG